MTKDTGSARQQRAQGEKPVTRARTRSGSTEISADGAEEEAEGTAAAAVAVAGRESEEEVEGDDMAADEIMIGGDE